MDLPSPNPLLALLTVSEGCDTVKRGSTVGFVTFAVPDLPDAGLLIRTRAFLRREVRLMAKYQGTVKWFNETKGYGFIARDDGSDVFVHYSAIEGQGFRSLRQGQRVEFEISTSPRGPRAEKVRIIG